MSENDPIPYVLVDRPPRPGDRVRVEYDAVYDSRDNYYGGDIVVFDTPGYNAYRGMTPPGALTVLEPPAPPAEIGDIVDATVAEKLPAGSRAYCLINDSAYTVRNGRLISDRLGVSMIASAGGNCIVLRVGE